MELLLVFKDRNYFIEAQLSNFRKQIYLSRSSTAVSSVLESPKDSFYSIERISSIWFSPGLIWFEILIGFGARLVVCGEGLSGSSNNCTNV